jgi:fatty acid desaturase
MKRRAMFSSRLERRRQVRRFARLVGVTVFVIGLGLVGVFAVQGFDFLGSAEADRLPLGAVVLAAIGAVFALSLIVYVAVRMFSRID